MYRLIRRELFCCLFKDCPNFFQRFISLTFICYCLLRTNRTKSKPPPTFEYYYEHLVSCSGGLLRARQMACSSLRPSSSTSSSRSQRFKWKTQRVVIRFELPRHLKLQIQGRLYQEKECTKTSPKGIPFFGFGSLLDAGELVVVSTKRPTTAASSRIMQHDHEEEKLPAVAGGAAIG